MNLGSGVYNNAGGSIEADGPGSIVNLASNASTINGGTLTSTNGGEIRSTVGFGTLLNGVTVTGGSDVVLGNGSDLRVSGGLTNNGTWSLNGTTVQTAVQFNGTQTITGTGEFVLGQNPNNDIITGANSDILTLDASQTIRGGGRLLQNSGGFINNGAIRQQGAQALTIDPGTPDVDGNGANFVNNSVLRTEGTGGLILNAAIYQNNTTIESTGGGDISFASNAVEIRGGNLTTSGGGAVRSLANGGALLDGVTITAGTDVVQANGEDFRIRNNLVNNGTWSLNGATVQTALQFLGTQSITATGEIVIGPNANNDIIVGSNADIITLDSAQTIRGGGNILSNAGGFINNGTILQQGAQVMQFDPGTPDVDGNGANFVNNSVLRSEGSGGINFNAGIYQNNTTFETTGGGDIRFLTNAVEIRGGNLTTSGGGVVRSLANSGALLDGVTLTAGSDVRQENGEDFRIRNGVTNNGTWTLNGSSQQTFLQFLGTQTLTGTGEVVMGNNVFNQIIVGGNNEVLTIDTDQTVRGAGQILFNAGGLINNGTILQQGTVKLRIDPGTPDVDGNGANFVNNSVLRSEGTGGLDLGAAIYQNNTTIETTGGGDILIASNAVDIRGGNLTTSGGGVVRLTVNNGPTLDGVTLTAGSDLVQNNGADLRLRNGITNDGTITLNGTSAQSFIMTLGSQTIGGSGVIELAGDTSSNDILVSNNADVITHGANHTIRGAGDILQNSGGFINQGTIIANRAVNEIVINAGTNFSNLGTMRAASGSAGFDIAGGTDFTQAGGLVDIQSGSRVDITFGDYVQTGGETRVTGTLATLGNSSNIQLQGGRLTGTGLVDFNGLGVHVLNNSGGTLAAGASPGVLTVQDGDYVQGAGGTFEFELDGFVAGIGHDLLTIVNGDADLGGDLSIIADQLFASTLNIGDRFEVVRLDATGVFEDGNLDLSADVFDTLSINLGGLNFSQLFDTNILGGTSLFIEVTLANVQPPGTEVPEPTHLVLMMLGLTAIVWMRRRRANVTVQ